MSSEEEEDNAGNDNNDSEDHDRDSETKEPVLELLRFDVDSIEVVNVDQQTLWLSLVDFELSFSVELEGINVFEVFLREWEGGNFGIDFVVFVDRVFTFGNTEVFKKSSCWTKSILAANWLDDLAWIE